MNTNEKKAQQYSEQDLKDLIQFILNLGVIEGVDAESLLNKYKRSKKQLETQQYEYRS